MITRSRALPPFRLLAACLVAAGLAACSSSCPGTGPPATAQTGASSADLAAIGRIHEEYVAAHNASDPDRLMALWTDDAVLMPMDEPAISGKQAIGEHYEEFFDQSPSEIALEAVETRVAGDWAFERVQITVTLPGGKEGTRHADVKYLWILQRQSDGSWKIARAIYNLDGNIDEEEGVRA
jgi:uncharacterized protein (TIGR02246 family)